MSRGWYWVINMPHFTCMECGNAVWYQAGDEAYFRAGQWECARCRRIVSAHRYPINVGGTAALFSSVGESLGDRIVFEVVQRMYRLDNPDETVVCLNPDDDHGQAFREVRPSKFFVGEFCRNDIPDDAGRVIRFNIMNEVCWYASQGIYPRLAFRPARPNLALPQRWIVLHLRNIEKVPERPDPARNVSAGLAQSIVDTIAHTSGLPILLVGNDDPLPVTGIHFDLRHRLTLPEIAWIIQHAVMYVGRDSGLVHVAAAVNARIVSWGYRPASKWLPKMPEDRYVALEDGEWDEERVQEEVGKGLHSMRNGDRPDLSERYNG